MEEEEEDWQSQEYDELKRTTWRVNSRLEERENARLVNKSYKSTSNETKMNAEKKTRPKHFRIINIYTRRARGERWGASQLCSSRFTDWFIAELHGQVERNISKSIFSSDLMNKQMSILISFFFLLRRLLSAYPRQILARSLYSKSPLTLSCTQSILLRKCIDRLRLSLLCLPCKWMCAHQTASSDVCVKR